jgi:HSP20 family protein
VINFVKVTLEEGKMLVIKSNGKRKRDEDEEGSKYLRLERRALLKFTRKFKLPDDANAEAISAKCENGVLSVVMPKLPPPEKKTKTVEVKIG